MTKSALEGQCHHFLFPSSPWGTARQINFTGQSLRPVLMSLLRNGLKTQTVTCSSSFICVFVLLKKGQKPGRKGV